MVDGSIPILIVDDDRGLCELVSDFLAPHGYRVESAHSGAQGLERITQGEYQAVILDVMMPGMDGFEFLKILRRTSEIPVLMLTSRGDEVDRIVGLEIGADDYIPKTFSSRELLARLRAVLRRSNRGGQISPDAELPPLFQGPLRIDQNARQVWLDSQELSLTRLEFDLLVLLVARPGRVVSRDFLLQRISGREFEWQDRTVDVHVSSLRKKLGEEPREPRFIKTVRGIGYTFIPQDGDVQ